jgi:hypothetical protein
MKNVNKVRRAIEFLWEVGYEDIYFKWLAPYEFEGEDEGCNFRGKILEVNEENFWHSYILYASDFAFYDEKDAVKWRLDKLFMRIGLWELEEELLKGKPADHEE